MVEKDSTTEAPPEERQTYRNFLSDVIGLIMYLPCPYHQENDHGDLS